MSKNSFAVRLGYFLKQSNTKSSTLANAVQYDLSYISKWLSGKMLPSEKNVDAVIANATACIMSEDNSKLVDEFNCSGEELSQCISAELKAAYQQCRPKISENRFLAASPISEVVKAVEEKIEEANDIMAVIDIFSLPHENRLIIAGIKNGHFSMSEKNKKYSMAININPSDCVYDSIFLVHMLTGLSGVDFRLHNSTFASGKFIYCIDDSVISSFVLPENKDCISVGEMSNGKEIRQNISTIFNQENLVFRKVTLSDMIANREYIQTMISTNICWIIGHATELLMPEDVFDELMAKDERDSSEYKRLYHLSQSILKNETTHIMIYESAISNLAVDGIIDFYNKPMKLTADQALRCIDYYMNLVNLGSMVKLIDGGFSDDFRYITNPCMFLSDSICYLRLENNRYSDNVLLLNDRMVKELFYNFFHEVWRNRSDVVTSEKQSMIDKLMHYRESARILL